MLFNKAKTALIKYPVAKTAKSYKIPNSVKTVEGSAFSSNANLTSVTIPNSVTSIGSYAFSSCSNLSTAIFLSEIPPKFQSNSFPLSSLRTVIVPVGSREYYKDVITGISVVKRNAVVFDSNGDDVTGLAAAQYIENGKKAKKPSTNPKRTGYSFVGWYTSSSGKTEYDFNSKVRTHTTVYAKWKAKTYKITYNLNSGKNDTSNPTKYTYGKSTSLKKPTRSGYAFAGWHTKESLPSSSKVTSISKTSTGNVTLYAKWVKLPAKTKSVSATANSKSKITVTWKKVSGAKGYEVYRATSKDGKYKKVKTVSKGATVKYADKSLKANKKYYYKVRAYKLVDGKRVYGEYSSVKSAKTKK